MSSQISGDRTRTGRWQVVSLAVGIGAMIPCVIGGAFAPVPFFRAYLAAYLFFVGLPLGSLVIVMIYHLTGGAWGYLVRRILEAQMKTLPLLAVLFAPIAWGLKYIYLWAQPAAVAVSANLQYKQFYLNATFFWIRAGIYFALWMGLAWLLASWSRGQDRTGEAKFEWRNVQLSGFGLVIYGVSIHFMAIDWLMSLQPAFRSTIFGPVVALGQLLPAYALTLIVFVWVARHPPVAHVISRKVMLDLGNLLLVFLVTWAYMEWFQFMLIWIANLPADVIWYLPRVRDGWRWVAWAIFVFQFAVPFILLLFRAVKQRPGVLAAVAGLIFFMQLVHRYYQVVPAFRMSPIGEHWMEFLTPIGMGGVWLAVFLRFLGRMPILPQHDDNANYAEQLRHLDDNEAAREEEMSDEEVYSHG
jgi:hypothetical protein